MVPRLIPGRRARRFARAIAALAVAALAPVAPRIALLGAVLLSIWWVARRDNHVGTWGVLYVLLLMIVAVLTLLVTALTLLAAPEGLRTLEEHIGDRADVTVVTAAVDERLNENAYIVPGLGDAGDRLYGIVD